MRSYLDRSFLIALLSDWPTQIRSVKGNGHSPNASLRIGYRKDYTEQSQPPTYVVPVCQSNLDMCSLCVSCCHEHAGFQTRLCQCASIHRKWHCNKHQQRPANCIVPVVPALSCSVDVGLQVVWCHCAFAVIIASHPCRVPAHHLCQLFRGCATLSLCAQCQSLERGCADVPAIGCCVIVTNTGLQHRVVPVCKLCQPFQVVLLWCQKNSQYQPCLGIRAWI